MAATYVKRYTNNGSPKSQPAITITAGKKRCVAIGFNSQGTISRITIKQTGGTSVAFAAELFDSMIPFPPGEYASAAAPADDLSLYRILPAMAATAGNAVENLENQWGYKYHNQDGGFTDNQRFIYLLIAPTSAGDLTTWDVVIAGEGPD